MSATTVSLTNPTLWASTFVGIVVCVARARVFRSKTGGDPWGMPLWVWALAGLVLGLIGAVLALIATRRSAIAGAQTKAGGFETSPLGVWPPSVNGSVGPTSAGWYPVRGDAYEQMYWDGTRWTTRIRWDGMTWVDAGRPPEAPAPVPLRAEAPPPSSALARFFMK